MKGIFLLPLTLLCLAAFVQCGPLTEIIKARLLKRSVNHVNDENSRILENSYVPVYIGPQQGLKEADKITALPGQPINGVNFDQYAGYVTVDPKAGRALFYYFVESDNCSSKPLVLWLNGGPGCSSVGAGAMTELGPFRVNPDGKTLWHNQYAWNNLANVLFLESPAGLDFLTQTNHQINLKGIAVGNAYVDIETQNLGTYNYLWSHGLISDEIHDGIVKNCNFTSQATISAICQEYMDQADAAKGHVYDYDIYAPLCSRSTIPMISIYDPCSGRYVFSYLNIMEVQKALHANTTGIPGKWRGCNNFIEKNWEDMPDTVLPVIQELMASGISVWIIGT